MSFDFHSFFKKVKIIFQPRNIRKTFNPKNIKKTAVRTYHNLIHLNHKTLLIILILLLSGVVILWKINNKPNQASAAWWNNNWQYRRAVGVTNTSGSVLTDFQISFTINTSTLVSSGKANPDCSDIRVTDYDGNILSHWVETNGLNACNQANTVVWVKMSSIPTNSSTIYVYYGNQYAASTSNGDNVFMFFDDFNNASIDTTTKWNKSGTMLTISNGRLRADRSLGTGSLFSKNTFARPFVLDMDYYPTQYPSGWEGTYHGSIGFGTYDTGFAVEHTWIPYGGGGNSYTGLCDDGGCYHGQYINPLTTGNILYKVNMQIQPNQSGTGYLTYSNRRDDNTGSSASGTVTTNTGTGNDPLYVGMHDYGSNTSDDLEWDNIRVRKYIATNPSATPQTEEINTAGATWWNNNWNYRQAIGITNSSGSTLSNQRIKITFNTNSLISSGKMLSDCNDIRVTDNTGNLLDHWDISCNTTSTYIYVKIPSIPSTGTTIYLYYGNSSAPSTEKTLGTTTDPGTSCQMMKDQGSVTSSGVYYITPGGNDTDKIQVYCDQSTQNGGWTMVLNNGAYTVPPKPTWNDAVNTNNITGSLGTNLDGFDQFLGLKHWNFIGGTMMVQVGSSPSSISKRATYTSMSLNTGNNYSLSLSGETINLGSDSPGINTYSAVSGYQFTTYDADHDVYGTNCSTSYSNTAWWYGACWSGSFWGGGDVDSYQNKPYWTSSGTDYYNNGQLYLRGPDTMKNTSVTISGSEQTKPSNPSGDWWDTNWNYRGAIGITNSGSAQTNTQIKILSNFNLTSYVSSGQIQPDLDDLRFTDSNGNLLNYWIEDSTNSSADVWLFVPSLPTTGTNVYVYYGNPNASAGKTIVGTQNNPGLSCRAVKLSGGTSDGTYYIDPNGGSITDAKQTYCDLSSDNGGWTLCLSVTSREAYSATVNNVPNGGDWRTDIYTTSYGSAFTGTSPTILQPGYIDSTKGGSLGCANFLSTGEIMALAHYSNNATKGVIGTLPANWKTSTDIAITGSKYKKGGTWTNTSSDYICAHSQSGNSYLYNPTSTTCADSHYANAAGGTWIIGFLGSNVENGATTCTSTDTWNTCGAWLVDNQSAWANEGDEIGDHGTYGGWTWSSGSDPDIMGMNIFVRESSFTTDSNITFVYKSPETKPVTTTVTWWDDNWDYRQAQFVNNRTGIGLTNFQVSFSIGTSALVNSGKMQSDCDDVRIIDNEGNQLTYWVDPSTCNTNSTIVWVKATSIPTDGTIIYLYFGNPGATNAGSNSWMPTGGTITTLGTNRIHTFTSSGTFTNSANLNARVLVVGGGGGGGMDMGGGGGGGGVLHTYALPVNAQTYTVTVGAGGSGSPAAGTYGQNTSHQYNISASSGQNSVFSNMTAYGGGYGSSSYYAYTPNNGYPGSGGCGGGASGYSDGSTRAGGAGTIGQGYRGGNGGGQYYSGGGGGAGGQGTDSTNIAHGGIGYFSDINGTGYYWGGGGGGAGYTICGGNGGAGGGGGGAVCTTTGGSGLNPGSPGGGGSTSSQTNTPGGNGGANTGGGGGGGSHYNANNRGGNGGSGIVIIRYPSDATPVTSQTEESIFGDWWNVDWQYRKTVTVTNTGSAQSNTQVKVLSNYNLSNLVSDGKLQSDLDDIRFTDTSGNILNYWIEDSTNNSADIWLFLPSLPTSGTSVRMYYGNPSATAGKTIVGTQTHPGLSCRAVKLSGGTVNQNYYIDTDGGNISNAIQLYCDLTTDNGGWTKVYHSPTDENSTSVSYITGTTPLIANSTMMFAFINESNNTLSTPWKFSTPSAFNTTTPMAGGQCGYVSITATRIADSTSTTQLLRYGYGSFGSRCDETCSGTWGQVCLKSNSTQGSYGGYSDFPMFTTFAYAGYDNCTRSDETYSVTQCSTTKKFVIFVRESSFTVDPNITSFIASEESPTPPSGGTPLSGSWWLTDWPYRRAIGITNTSGSTLTNFQVSFSIGTSALIASGKMNTNCSDIRLTDINGNAVPFWIEENNPGCNQITDTKIWTKLNSISTRGTIVYLYYGNPSASSTQNGNNVFEFFDDFSSASIDTNKWQLNSVNSITSSINNGKLRITDAYKTSTNGAYWIYDNTDTGSQHKIKYGITDNVVVEWRNSINDTAIEQMGQAGFAFVDNSNLVRAYLAHNDGWNAGATVSRHWIYETTSGTENGSPIETANFKISRSGTNVQFYVNGISKASGAITGAPVAISLAATGYGTSFPYVNYNDIDYVFTRKYASADPSTIILDEESRTVHTNTFNVGTTASLASKTPPLAYWKFDEGFGTILNNSGSSGSSLNGSFGPGAYSPAWTNDGKFNKALRFDGGDYASMGNVLNLGTSQFTIEAWAKWADNGTQQAIVTKGSGTGNPVGYRLMVSPTGNIIANIGDFTNSANAITVKNYPANTWHHLVMVNLGSSLAIYVDSNLAQQTSSNVTNIDNAYSFNIGRQEESDTYYFNGQIDNVRVYNRALTANEIKLNHNNSSALQFSSMSSGSGNTAPPGAASQEYCVPGDSSPCSPPVAEWNMDENTGSLVNDSSGNNNTGTFGIGDSSPSWTIGKYSSGLNFDGVNDYVDMGNGSSLNNLTDLTISAWINIGNTSPSYRSGIVSRRNGINGGLNFDVSGAIEEGGGRQIEIFEGGGGGIQGATKLSFNTWYHVAAVMQGTSVKLYVNGSLDGSGTTSWTWDSSTPVYIGNIGNINNYLFKGRIDQVKIYNYARTPTQIAWDYNKGKPVAWWKFDECQGSTAFDSSGIGNTGSINIGTSGSQNSLGTCSIGTSAAWTNGASGKLNSSLNFDGVDDYVNIADTTNSYLDIGQPGMTISAWIKPKTLSSGEHTIVGKNSPYLLWVSSYNGNYYIRSALYKNSDWNVAFSADHSISIGVWQHVVVTYDGAIRKIYINGIQSGNTDTQISGNIDVSNSSLTIGQDFDSRYFDGQIDDVRLYNYALTPYQIKTLFNNGAVSFN